MTDDSIALRALLDKASEADLLADMIDTSTRNKSLAATECSLEC